MKNFILNPVLVLVLFVFVLNSQVSAQNHIVLNTFNVDIYTGPSTENTLVGKAGKSTIFKLRKELDNWVEVELYSGTSRYILKEKVYFLKSFISGHNMTLPENDKLLSKIYKEIEEAKIIARKNASEIIPVTVNAERHENYYNLRFDQLCHEIFEVYGLQPALYPELVDKVKRRLWEMGKSRNNSQTIQIK